MTWTYSAVDTDDLNTARRLAGDTDTGNQGVSDEVVTALLVTESTPRRAAIAMLDVMIAALAREAPVQFTGGTYNAGDTVDRLIERKAALIRDLSHDSAPAPVWIEPATDQAFTRSLI